MADIRDTDWSNVFIGSRALTVFNQVYGVSSNSNYEVTIPGSTSQFRSENWNVLNIQRMNDTSNLVVMGINTDN